MENLSVCVCARNWCVVSPRVQIEGSLFPRPPPNLLDLSHSPHLHPTAKAEKIENTQFPLPSHHTSNPVSQQVLLVWTHYPESIYNHLLPGPLL